MQCTVIAVHSVIVLYAHATASLATLSFCSTSTSAEPLSVAASQTHVCTILSVAVATYHKLLCCITFLTLTSVTLFYH
jgi:hypothetical protein